MHSLTITAATTTTTTTAAAAAAIITETQPCTPFTTYSLETNIIMTDVTVDKAPISPVREATERRNSLEKHLQQRPDPQDLKNRHILLDTTAAPYAPAFPVLLSPGLEARPC